MSFWPLFQVYSSTSRNVLDQARLSWAAEGDNFVHTWVYAALLSSHLENYKTMRWMVALLIGGVHGFNPHWPLHSHSHLRLTCELLKPGGSSASSRNSDPHWFRCFIQPGAHYTSFGWALIIGPLPSWITVLIVPLHINTVCILYEWNSSASYMLSKRWLHLSFYQSGIDMNNKSTHTKDT